MKHKILLFLGVLLLVFNGIAQTENSVLSKGEWYKFSIDTTGVFKIDLDVLKDMGVNTTNLNPKNIRIYGNGGAMLSELNQQQNALTLKENALFVKGEDDGVFHADDYVLFYGKGPHDWKINVGNESAEHRQNLYSDKAYYFLTITEGAGLRMKNSSQITSPASSQITFFDDFVFHELESRNLFAIGRQWFGEDFSVNNSQNFNFNFSNSLPNSPMKIRVRAAAISSTNSKMNVVVNGQQTFDLSFLKVNDGSLTLGHTAENSLTFVNSNSSVNLAINYLNNGNPGAKAYLDYIEIQGKKQLVASGKQFSFRSFDAYKALNNVIEYKIENKDNIQMVWNVTTSNIPEVISNNSPNSANFTFKTAGGILEEYVLVSASDYYLPIVEKTTPIANQNIHGIKDVNYLIITNKTLYGQAKRLADYHVENSGLVVEVVLVSEIYNEFSSGSQDISAIRNFIKKVYETNSTSDKKLKYVCFFGDGSYDYKDKIDNNNNIVPVYHANESFNLATSYVTDDFYAMLDVHEGNMFEGHTIDVATGRIPVTTVLQARSVVNKMLHYYSSASFGDWRNVITLVADDIDSAGEENLQFVMEKIADSISKRNPIFNITKIYSDAYKQETSSGGERYPAVNKAITNAITKGTLMLDYFGHGGEDGLADERILEIPQIENLENYNTLPLFITVTCEFSRFDNPLRTTAGEKLFWNSNGGAVSLITTTREIFISIGQEFNERLIKVLLAFENDENLSISESLMKAKNGFSSKQKYFVYYFGDPAMRLAIPKPNIALEKLNGVSIKGKVDTLKALSKVRFEGVVTDASNKILTDFNGTLSASVFDKPIIKTTLDNNNSGITMEFDSRESKLFKGKSTVTNGKFNFEFVVPKDIKFAYGKGKISFYAENQTIDKSGVNFDVVVGGINENAVSDTKGPDIKLFMNNESFTDGGTTNSSPNLIVSLFDDNGINTSITSIDHDIVAILDGDEANPIILNDYYNTELDDFTNGKINYPLRDLSSGVHSIKIKAWDTYNNLSEATLNFLVVNDSGLVLENVLNYPNPFVNYTEFWFQHNKKNEPLDVQIQIFSISGKLIKTINQSVQTIGGQSRSIHWNGLDDFGNKIGKGVYVYKLKVTATISKVTSEKFEKLVIL